MFRWVGPPWRRGIAAAIGALALAPAASLGASSVVAAADDPAIGPPVRVDVLGSTAAANELTIVAGESFPLEIIAAWNDWRESIGNNERIRIGVGLSLDGGHKWSDWLLRPPAAHQSDVEGDPMTAIDPRTGSAWVGGISFAPEGGLFVARRDPGATEFEAPVMAFVTGAADKCWMAAGPAPDEPEVTMLYITCNLGLLCSDDLGQTWSAPRALRTGIGYLPRVGPDGALYIGYWDSGAQFKIKRSVDRGETFTEHHVATRMDIWGSESFNTRLPGTFRAPPFLHFAVDQRDGAVFAVYADTTDYVDGNADVDLYFCASFDDAETWTTPTILSGDFEPTGDQFFPWIEVDREGRIHLVWVDSRHTEQDDNIEDGLFDNYYMYSSDRGDTWHEYRLTAKSWSSRDDGLNRAAQFIGDYYGLTTAGNAVYPLCLETGAGDPDIFTNTIAFGAANPADLNADGSVDGADLVLLLGAWGPCDDCAMCLADIDADCTVGTSDLLILLGNWG